MISRRRLVSIAGLVATAGAACAVVPPAFAGSVGSNAGPADPHLPAPTGPRAVGTTVLHMVDTSRADPWVPNRPRELMVSLWYPAVAPGRQRAHYMTAAESAALLTYAGITSVPLDVSSRTRFDAYTDAVPAGAPHSLPLVVLSPGFTKPRCTVTGLAEDLASHGYLVAVVDHTYENVATTFPDGRVASCVACDLPNHDAVFWTKIDQGRADDVSFVLDQLTAAQPRCQAAALIDRNRIAMAGHSAGGSAAMPTMVRDPRVRAGIDIDGSTNAAIPATGLSRPFLFLGRRAQYTPGTGGAAATWEHDWPLLTGWKRWILVTGAVHESFTDVALLAEQVGIDSGADLSGERSAAITRAYVRAFFDLYLRTMPQPLLDGASASYPEVTFVSP